MIDVFSYRATTSGEVHISWRGTPVTTLRGPMAKHFLARARRLDDDGAQHLMARVAANFKRANER